MIDKQTFEQIFRHHYDGMFRLARRMLGDDAESKDVVSDVFASLLGKDETELKTDTLQGFLLTSVRNRCVNLLVHKQKEQAAIVNLKDNEDDGIGQEKLNALRDYIDTRLPELSQQILRLRFQQGLKYREIADALQVSEVTVYNHLSQSLKQMKEHFKAKGYDI
ncbi:MAG: sigma-70 family RNA polymerase sigma factor [Prevotella sp.]|jgi:RNA polymerase sigma-70 factor (ECF subfamily)|nr:sigma-70 family RNA polymerase sigma factor [Prevotella sp.]